MYSGGIIVSLLRINAHEVVTSHICISITRVISYTN